MNIRLYDLLNWGGLGLVILGVVIASEVLPLSIQRPLPLGIILAGIGLGLAFADALFRGEISTRRRGFSPEVFHGLAARLWGALMVLVGAVLTVGGMIEFALPSALGRWLGSTGGTGVALALAGTVVGAYGLVHVLGAAGGRDSWSERLAALAGMGIYSLVVLLGMILLAAALVQLVAPGLSGAVVQTVREAIPPIPTLPFP